MEAERIFTSSPPNYNYSDYSNIVLQHYTTSQLVALRIVTLLLAIIGLIGNLLVVLVILSRRRWRFANSMFVLNIAIANLFICAFTLPLMVRALFDVSWVPAVQFCQLSGFLDNTAFACSAWSLALGSVERFFLVVFPIKHRELMKYQRAVALSCLTWAVSIFLSVLPILGWNVYRYSPLTFTCGIDTNLPAPHLYYFLVYLTIVFPGPLIISTVSYSYILFYLRVHRAITAQIFPPKKRAPPPPPAAEGADQEGPQAEGSAQAPAAAADHRDIFGTDMSDLWRSPKRRSKNIKVVLPMILISVAFLLCFMPTVIVGFDITINPGHENGQPRLQMIEYFIIHLLLLGNSAMNPLIFTMCSSKFRISALVVTQQVGERLLLLFFYAIYLVYYGGLTLCKGIGDTISRICSSNQPSCTGNKYDSLQDEVVVKITISNNEQQQQQQPLAGNNFAKQPGNNNFAKHGGEQAEKNPVQHDLMHSTRENRTSETLL